MEEKDPLWRWEGIRPSAIPSQHLLPFTLDRVL